jgi:hypothetical protein
MPYQMTIEEYPLYLHTKASGEHSVENVLRFLQESHAACAERGRQAVLLEVAFTGPSLDAGGIFKVIMERSESGKMLRKIGYVDPTPRDRERVRFAENVAFNRGVNVRLFQDVESAKAWMEVP